MTTARAPEPVDFDRPPDWFREIARQQGYGAALASLHRAVGPDTLLCGPGGHAVASADTAERARRWYATGITVDRAAEREVRVTTVPLQAAGLVALRCGPFPPGATSDYHPWALRVTWLRLGLSNALLDAAVQYLEGRSTGGEPLLKQQLLKGALADAVIAHLEIETMLSDGGATLPALVDLNQHITQTDRGLLRLLGASGYTIGGPGHSACVSEMLADAYIGPAGSGVSL